MQSFTALEQINLESNQLDNDQVFMSLSTVPRLKTVNLANNRLVMIPSVTFAVL
jgi:Leucine-rich repeat (LRR) protein